MRGAGFVRWTLRAIVVLLALVAATVVVLQTPWAHERARLLVEARAAKALNGQLRIGRLEGSFFGHVTFSDVEVTQQGKPVIAATSIDARYQPWRVFTTGTIDVIAIRGLRLNVIEEDDGWNVMGLGADREPDAPRGPGPDIAIAALDVTDGHIRVAPRDGEIREIVDLQFAGGLDYSARRLQMSLERLTARDPATGVAIRELSSEIEIADGGVAFETLHLVTDGSRVDGDVVMKKDAAVDVNVTAAPLSLPELAHYVPALRRLAVTPSVEVTARGAVDRLDFTAQLTSAAGNVSARGRMTRTPGVTTLNGTVHTVRLNPGEWLNDRELQGSITADGTIEATIPEAAPSTGLVKFDVRAPAATFSGMTVSAARARGQYAGGVLDVAGAAAAYGSTIDTTARWDGDTLTARGDMLHVNVRRLPAMLKLPAITTDVSGTYDVTVARSAWKADLTLARSTVEDGIIADGTRVAIDRMTTEIAYDVQGEVSNLDLSRLRPFVTLEPAQERWLDGRVNARVVAQGRSTDLATAIASVDAQLTNSVVAGMQIPALDVRATLDHRRLSADVKGTVAGVTHQTVGAGPTVPFAADGSIDAHVTLPDVTDPARLEHAAGRANIRLTGATVRDIRIDSLELEGALAGGVAEIRTFVLSAPDTRITASGTLAVDPSADLESDFTYDLAAADLSTFEALIGRAVEGALTAKGRVTGPAMRLATQGELTVSQLSIANVQALTISGRYDVVVPDRDVSRSTSRFDGTGTFVQVGETGLDRVTANATYVGGRLDLETTISQKTRTIALTGALVPHPDHREVHVSRLALAAGGPEWRLADGQEAVIQYGEDRVVVRHLDLVSGGSKISVNGEIGGVASGAGPLLLSLHAVRLEDINQLMLGTHKIAGQLDGVARVEGPMKMPRVTGDIAVISGEVDGVRFERLTAKGEYAADAITVDASLEAGPAGRLTARGVMPVRFGASAPEGAPAFDLVVQTEALDMGLLQPAVGDHVEAVRGRASVDVRIAGPARAPTIKGKAAIAEAAVTIAATGMSYTRLNAVLAFDGTRMNVEQFTISDDDQHTATLTGALNLSLSGPPSDFDLHLTTDDFHLLNNAFGEVAVTSEVRAMGTLVAPLLTGTISVDRARLEVDDLLDRFAAGGYKPVEAAGAPAPRDPAAETSPAAAAERDVQKAAIGSQASYSLTLDLPDSVVLRGRDVRARGGSFGLGDLNITLGGALSLAKDTNAPTTVVGTLNVVRGNYTFQGRRFTIARDSQIRFAGEEVLNPMLDVTAERQIGGVQARVQVTGTAREPEIALSSDPPLDEGDILSLIAFNQTMNELGTTERVSLAARAGTLAARALATPLADSVARALDFDVFEIQPSENGATGGTLTVGRQVTEDLFVGFRQEFGTDDVSVLSFEYRINEFLRLVTSFAQGAERSRTLPRAETAGIDLFYVIRR